MVQKLSKCPPLVHADGDSESTTQQNRTSWRKSVSLWIVVNGPYAIVDDAYDSGRVEEMQHQILISLSADKELYDPLAALVVQQLSLYY